MLPGVTKEHFEKKLCVLTSLFMVGNALCLECTKVIPRCYLYLKQYSKHRLWPTSFWDLTGRKHTTLSPDQCKDKWSHCTRLNIMELACACDLSFLRIFHTVQDCSLILLSAGQRGTNMSCISAPQLPLAALSQFMKQTKLLLHTGSSY